MMRKSSRGNPYHDELGRFCSGSRCATYSELSESEYRRRTEERTALENQKAYDLKSTDGVKSYLTEQFEANGYQPVSVMTDEGWVTVEPYCYAPEPSADKVEYYNVVGPTPWMGSESIDTVSKDIANISESMKDYRKSKSDLAEFHKNNIANKSPEEHELSRQVSNKVYEDWKDSGFKESIDDYFNAHAAEYTEYFGKSAEEVKAAWILSDNLSFYSDWHKDLYGFRPR